MEEPRKVTDMVRISQGDYKGQAVLRFYTTPRADSIFIDPLDIDTLLGALEVAKKDSGLKLDPNYQYKDELIKNKGAIYLGYSSVFKNQMQLRRLSTGTEGEVKPKSKVKHTGYTY